MIGEDVMLLLLYNAHSEVAGMGLFYEEKTRGERETIRVEEGGGKVSD